MANLKSLVICVEYNGKEYVSLPSDTKVDLEKDSEELDELTNYLIKASKGELNFLKFSSENRMHVFSNEILMKSVLTIKFLD